MLGYCLPNVLRKNQKIFVYLVILLLPLFLLFIRPVLFDPFKKTFLSLSALPMRVISFGILEFKKIVFYRLAYDEYLKLKRENDTLKSRLIGLNEVIKENARLSELLEYKRSLVYASVSANIIGRDPASWNSSLIIDKGSRQGIRQGMPVIHPSGIIGKVAEVYPNVSKVIVLTDPQFNVAAVLEESRESGLFSGTLRQDLCRLRYINGKTQVKVGENVITSRISSTFPENLMIGQVVEILPSGSGGALECLVKPSIDISHIEEVLVIIR